MMNIKMVKLAHWSYLVCFLVLVAGIVDTFTGATQVFGLFSLSLGMFLLGEYFWKKAQP